MLFLALAVIVLLILTAKKSEEAISSGTSSEKTGNVPASSGLTEVTGKPIYEEPVSNVPIVIETPGIGSITFIPQNLPESGPALPGVITLPVIGGSSVEYTPIPLVGTKKVIDGILHYWDGAKWVSTKSETKAPIFGEQRVNSGGQFVYWNGSQWVSESEWKSYLEILKPAILK